TLEGRELVALSGIDLQVKEGEFVSVLGPSGCGKSTLVNIIAGVDDQTSGEVVIDGSHRRLGKSGYMPQKPLLLPWRTVRGNVVLSPLIQKQPVEASRHKADKLLKKFGLLAFANQYPAVLSGGMAQKAALLRTILTNNKLLLMDEPFGALDAVTRLSMQMWLLEVWSEIGCSVLFITHDIREAILLSDRIYVLSGRPGRIVKEIAITLPRPRKREFLTKEAALGLEAELEGMLLTP
ncbi:MAG TPA: ABC transporter ATP-binding protein, partial [Candidatus Polarisedimenticolaceae bacterium]|nr:ABC transporter ATP-binding protein [Candidatus Polarisedimenticolaceae bacterium]